MCDVDYLLEILRFFCYAFKVEREEELLTNTLQRRLFEVSATFQNQTSSVDIRTLR
jgi:hypothetical protein